jgi:type II secretory pathway pseudopilin PulG
MNPRRARRTIRRAFSVVELLIALLISSLLLTACLVALDGSFKSYERTSESASTHTVSRLVMYRIMTMLRQGAEFRPQPFDVLTEPKLENQKSITFITDETFTPTGPGGAIERRHSEIELEIERDPDLDESTSTVESFRERYRLAYSRTGFLNGAATGAPERGYLIRNLLGDSKFELEYDVGPRLIRATVDLAIVPDDIRTNDASIATDFRAKVLRLVASTSPRRLDER